MVKYWVTKRNAPHAAEALEALGGNGYVEESPMPRLLRDAPLNSVWEGSGNVIALDVLRAIAKEPAAADAFLAEVGLAAGMDERLDAAVGAAGRDVVAVAADPAGAASGARRLVERLALVLQGSLIVRHSPPAVAEAFLATRLSRGGGLAFGTLPRGIDCDSIVDRHRPRMVA